jgi:hypothetical protein
MLAALGYMEQLIVLLKVFGDRITPCTWGFAAAKEGLLTDIITAIVITVTAVAGQGGFTYIPGMQQHLSCESHIKPAKVPGTRM